VGGVKPGKIDQVVFEWLRLMVYVGGKDGQNDGLIRSKRNTYLATLWLPNINHNILHQHTTSYHLEEYSGRMAVDTNQRDWLRRVSVGICSFFSYGATEME
jgi:hypothetical protein